MTIGMHVSMSEKLRYRGRTARAGGKECAATSLSMTTPAVPG